MYAGFSKKIDEVLIDIPWITVGCLRIGYDTSYVTGKTNPAVLQISVEKDKVSKAEGQRIVKTLEDAMIE